MRIRVVVIHPVSTIAVHWTVPMVKSIVAKLGASEHGCGRHSHPTILFRPESPVVAHEHLMVHLVAVAHFVLLAVVVVKAVLIVLGSFVP